MTVPDLSSTNPWQFSLALNHSEHEAPANEQQPCPQRFTLAVFDRPIGEGPANLNVSMMNCIETHSIIKFHEFLGEVSRQDYNPQIITGLLTGDVRTFRVPFESQGATVFCAEQPCHTRCHHDALEMICEGRGDGLTPREYAFLSRCDVVQDFVPRTLFYSSGDWVE